MQAVHRRVHQRCRAPVVLIGGVRVEDLWHDVVALRAYQDSVVHSGYWIGLAQVGEGEDIGGVVEVEERPGVARWLGELVIEIAAAAARHVGPNPVKDALPLLIAVESLKQESPQEPAALGAAERQRPFCRRRQRSQLTGRRAALQGGDKVPDSRHPQPHYRRVLRLVHYLVNLARFKARRLPHRAPVVRKTPLFPGDDSPGPIRQTALSQRRRCACHGPIGEEQPVAQGE